MLVVKITVFTFILTFINWIVFLMYVKSKTHEERDIMVETKQYPWFMYTFVYLLFIFVALVIASAFWFLFLK